MKFADFVRFDAVTAELTADDKEGVIRELVGSLARAGAIQPTEAEAIIASILMREELGSTGIGRGAAVPHTKHASVDRPVGTVGVSSGGVDFNSLDGEKVHLFFLVISPPDRPGDHLRALENISRHVVYDPMFRRFLTQAQTADEIKHLLEEADHKSAG
jgi:PTS system fructose-specific IIA component/PTS system nitrogen regulatory IIA component